MQDVRTRRHADRADGGHRHHGVIARAKIDIVDALRRFAEILFRLEHHFVGPSEEIEVVNLKAPEIDLQALEDVIDGDIQRTHFVAIDIQLDLGNGSAVGRVNTGEFLTFGHGLHELYLSPWPDSCGVRACLILQFEDESGGIAQTIDGRRRENQ